MLKLDGVRFRHAPDAEPYRFDLEVAPGEIVGVAGASGAGKSTLLDLIAGFLSPQAGDIALDGVSLLPMPPERRPVSILFQADNLFEHLTAAGNVTLALAGQSVSRSERNLRAREALSAVDLGDLSNRPVAKLSGGQQQRVALARTLLRNRPVLLLDEPFTGLDDGTAAAMHAHVARLVAEHRWHTVLVTHDAGDLAALANRILVLRAGELQPRGA